MRDVVKGRQVSESCPSKTAAGLMTVQRTGPIAAGAVPSLNSAATIAATPPAAHVLLKLIKQQADRGSAML